MFKYPADSPSAGQQLSPYGLSAIPCSDVRAQFHLIVVDVRGVAWMARFNAMSGDRVSDWKELA